MRRRKRSAREHSGTTGCSFDNKLVAEIAEKHLLLLAADPKGREVGGRGHAAAVGAGGSPSPGQGGRLNVAKGCYRQKPRLIHIE